MSGLLSLLVSSEPGGCYQFGDYSEILGLDTMKIYLNLLCDFFSTGVFDHKIRCTQDLYVLMWITKPFNGEVKF